ncbi:BAT2 domain-containing protein [Salix suchowensis]|nr:BAT2 domain-containing protein [Salix suchowensis]
MVNLLLHLLGEAWTRLENFAVNLADSIQHGSLPGSTGSVAPSLLETGKAFTAKGMQVLEYVGKETMDLLITETGIEVEKNTKNSAKGADEDHLLEEMTFDRCFYIYGGPEQLEELEALSNHYALLFNRRKAKLSSEEKSAYDGKLKLVQQIFSLSTDGNAAEFDKVYMIQASARLLTWLQGNFLDTYKISGFSWKFEWTTPSLSLSLMYCEMVKGLVRMLATCSSEGMDHCLEDEVCCCDSLVLGKDELQAYFGVPSECSCVEPVSAEQEELL